jgi:hypothetical protein
VQPVDAILADYATTTCGRPVRRQEHALPTRTKGYVTWAIDGDVMVEFLPALRGPGRLLVHEIALLAPLKKQLRTRHVTVEYSPA